MLRCCAGTRSIRYRAMPARDSKPPRGKVRSKTPVPAPTRPDEPDAPRPHRGFRRAGLIVVPVLAVLVAIGVGILLGVRSSRTSDDSSTPPVATETTETTPTQTAPLRPVELFGQSCASCHTLAAAGSTAGIGPNLDEARPSRQRVLNQIRNGSLSGAMPANLLTGADAERVAAYVSRVADR